MPTDLRVSPLFFAYSIYMTGVKLLHIALLSWISVSVFHWKSTSIDRWEFSTDHIILDVPGVTNSSNASNSSFPVWIIITPPPPQKN